MSNTILDGYAGWSYRRPKKEYDPWRPSNYEILLASHRVSRRGPHASKRDTAIVIYNIVKIFTRNHDADYTAKTGGYQPFDSNCPWEYWKIESDAWFDLKRRKKLVAKLKSALPTIQIEPIFRTWRNEYQGTRGCVLSFKKTKQSWAEDKVIELEERFHEKAVAAKIKRASATKWVSVYLYGTIQELPDDHPVKNNPDVIRYSRRIGEYRRREVRLNEAVEKAWSAKVMAYNKYQSSEQESDGPLYQRYKELDAKYDAIWDQRRHYEPHRVEGEIYQKAVVAAWRAHYPKEGKT